MRSSTVPARVSQSRSREPLRWLRRSALRSPCPAPHRASLSNSISRWAAKPIISRRNVASEPFSRSVRRAILSSVIVVILRSELRVQPNPTQDRHGGRRPARLRQTLGGRSGGPSSGLLHHHQGHNRFGQCFDTALGEYRSIPFRDLLHQRHDGGHLMREIKQLREVHAVQNKSGVLNTPIAADQKAITPIPLHCREIEARQQRRTTILRYVPLPQVYRALDVAPLIRPSLRCTNRAILGRLLPFRHGQPPSSRCLRELRRIGL